MEKRKLMTLDNISFGYTSKNLLLRNCTSDFYSNQIYSLLGKNGVGKTTLLNLIVGNISPHSGAIVKHVESTDIGFMSDNFFYYEGMSMLDMVDIICVLRNIDRNYIVDQIAMYTELFNLEQYTTTEISKLSYGTKKRVHMLLTLLHNPKLIVLDEPTNGLDPGQIIKFKQNIYRLKNLGKTLIVSTHSIKIAEDISDHTLMLTHQKLVPIEATKNLEDAFVDLS